MVKTNIIKTKKFRKNSIFFLIYFLQNTQTVLGHFYENFFSQIKKNSMNARTLL